MQRRRVAGKPANGSANRRDTGDPIATAPAENPSLVAIAAADEPVTIVLDLVRPRRPFGRSVGQSGKARTMPQPRRRRSTALHAADYGRINISKSITIDCTGTGSVIRSSSLTAVTVNAAGIIVTLRGLDLLASPGGQIDPPRTFGIDFANGKRAAR